MTTRLSEGQREALMLLAREQSDPEVAAQMALVTTYEGSGTMARFDVPSPDRLAGQDGLCPRAVAVIDGTGDQVGELMLWVENGRIDTVEQTWYSGDAPTSLPSRESVSTYRDLGHEHP